MLFEELISVYSGNYTTLISRKCGVAYCLGSWYIYLPFGFKALNSFSVHSHIFVLKSLPLNERGRKEGK
jgi:hypothetical protein